MLPDSPLWLDTSSQSPAIGPPPRGRTTWLVGCLLGLLFWAPGCGSRSPSPSPDASTSLAVQPARVAAASDLRVVFPALREEFRRLHPTIDLEPTFGSSGQFFTQISQGAPFDLFLSADIELVRKLSRQDATRPSSIPFDYAAGQLALWVPHQSSCDLSEALSEILRKIPPGKISLANPEHAPYGRAAREVLKSLELDSSLAPHLVLADNVAQALQFADSGGAAAAFVAVSLVRKGPASSRGRWRIVPAQHHRPIQQGGLVLPGGPGEPAARLFADWLQTPPARKILSDHGFLTSKE